MVLFSNIVKLCLQGWSVRRTTETVIRWFPSRSWPSPSSSPSPWAPSSPASWSIVCVTTTASASCPAAKTRTRSSPDGAPWTASPSWRGSSRRKPRTAGPRPFWPRSCTTAAWPTERCLSKPTSTWIWPLCPRPNPRPCSRGANPAEAAANGSATRT